MSLLAPGFLWLAGLVVVALVVAHLFSRLRPREAILPTARFVPEGAARAPTRARGPSDLLLLLVRAAMIALIGFAFSRPVIDAGRRDNARVFVVDGSRHVAEAQEDRGPAMDSIRSLHREGDVILAFDTVARRVTSADSLAGLLPGDAPGSLSVALIAAMREAAVLARRADSIELVLLSPIAAAEVDSATFAIRAMWPGRIRVIRSAARAPRVVESPVELRASADDPLRAAIELGGGVADAEVRVVRGPMTRDDSAWVRNGPRVLVAWPPDRANAGLAARAPSDSVGAVTAGGRVVVAPFQRGELPMAGRTVARWLDGAPAATEAVYGAGCIRSIAVSLPTSGDLTLRSEFGRFLHELLAPCGGRWTALPAADAVVNELAGAGVMAGGGDLRSERPSEPGRAGWLLVAALLLALLEHVLRGQQRAQGGGVRPQPQPAGADA